MNIITTVMNCKRTWVLVLTRVTSTHEYHYNGREPYKQLLHSIHCLTLSLSLSRYSWSIKDLYPCPCISYALSRHHVYGHGYSSQLFLTMSIDSKHTKDQIWYACIHHAYKLLRYIPRSREVVVFCAHNDNNDMTDYSTHCTCVGYTISGDLRIGGPQGAGAPPQLWYKYCY